MRMVLAIVVCMIVGALLFNGVAGAGLGFLIGLVIGLVWQGAAREAKQAAAAATVGGAPVAPVSLSMAKQTTEMERLTARLAALEQRVARLDGGVVGSAVAEQTLVAPADADAAPADTDATPAVAPVEPLIPPQSVAAAHVLPASAAPTSAVEPALAMTMTIGPTPLQRLLSGNVFAKIGILILFIGVSFLIKFGLENGVVPVEVWFALAALGGAILLVIGWRLRERMSGYALILQGGGIGIMYLVIFGAFKLFQLLPPTFAFALLVAIVVLSAILAILQNALSLAAVGVSGGFLAPVLIATGQGNHVALFSYYAILNAGIFIIAWYKAWRELNLLGFVFTASIGFIWGNRSYTPELFATTEPFLLLFFVMYVGIAVLFALRQAPNLKDYVDGTLVFGVPIVGFALQAAVVRHIEYGMAFSALVLSLFYLTLAWLLYARKKEGLRLLVESFFALALIFGTLTIPLALDARWTSAAWAVEGAAVLWAGIRQRRLLPRAFGGLLQLGAAVAFITEAQHGVSGGWPVLNSNGLGIMMIALAGLFSALQLHRWPANLRAGEAQLSRIVFVWGALWWLALGYTEIDRLVPDRWLASVSLLFLAGSAIAFSIASRALAWPIARWPALLLLPFMWVIAVIAPGHPSTGAGWIAWPVVLAVHYWMLRRHDDDQWGRYARHWLEGVHAGTLLLIAFLGARELQWWPQHNGLAQTAWAVAAAIVVPSLLLYLLSNRAAAGRWPLVRYARPCVVWAGCVLASGLVIWMWYANFAHDGSSAPLPYLPLLNALDLGHILAGLAILTWLLRLRDPDVGPVLPGRPDAVIGIAGATAFLWLNGMLLRTIHHWAAIPYQLDAMSNSLLVQAALSLFWTLLAFALMLVARTRRQRTPWMVGAVLMAVVVVKLFILDLSNLSGIERIVAFIGVGILMLLMGYFVPLPPKNPAELAQEPSS
ncbi:MAG: DUF2339 domain-containing protein [Betaproteobacteria bacterium]